MKVYNWEGGIRGVGFVRGTNSVLAPVPAGVVRTGLLHATDWFATVCRLAGVAPATRYPLDGHDVWDVIARGAPSPRTSIVHNAPVGRVVANGSMWTTGACMSGVDPAVGGFGGCHAFGITGAALRLGDFKLLVTHNGRRVARTRARPPAVCAAGAARSGRRPRAPGASRACRAPLSPPRRR
jgi:hypothetical protein